MLDIYQCPAYIEEKISSKGNKYFQLSVKLTPDYTFHSFLNEEQIQILKMYLMLRDRDGKSQDIVESE